MPDTLGVTGLVIVALLLLAAAVSLLLWGRKGRHQERGERAITEQLAAMQSQRAATEHTTTPHPEQPDDRRRTGIRRRSSGVDASVPGRGVIGAA